VFNTVVLKTPSYEYEDVSARWDLSLEGKKRKITGFPGKTEPPPRRRRHVHNVHGGKGVRDHPFTCKEEYPLLHTFSRASRGEPGLANTWPEEWSSNLTWPFTSIIMGENRSLPLTRISHHPASRNEDHSRGNESLI